MGSYGSRHVLCELSIPDRLLLLMRLVLLKTRHDIQGCGLTSVSFNDDGHLLATRAMDDTVKLWDIRKLGGGVVKTFSDVPTHLVSRPMG